jgi:hypothetical protein
MFVNLTKHIINEVISGTQIQPSGIEARVDTTTTQVSEHCGVPITQTTMSSVIKGLPDPVEGTIYIVPAQVLNASTREDLVATGNPVRENGKITGCRSLRMA